MVKTKQGHLISMPDNNSNTEDEGWVIVKKQKVTILIPPLPATNKSTMPNLGPSQLQAMPRTTLYKQSQYQTESHLKQPLPDEQEKSTSLPANRCKQSQYQTESHLRQPLVDEQEKSTSFHANSCIQIARKTPRLYIPTIAKPPMIDSRMELENPVQAHASKSHNTIWVSNTSRTIKRPRSLHCIGGSLDRSVLLNQRLRALNLERKLQKAGGLSRWLASLGLEQFVRLFQGKSYNKFQLVNLTMKKLKDMGADAVGPRRKLMHAIECVCQPYCFEAL